MTNSEQIRTKKASLVLALSVLIFTGIATYFSRCHDIDIMRITTPIILGLVTTIILCGVLQRFFYRWLTKNHILFSSGKPSAETLPTGQAADVQKQCPPSPQPNQDSAADDCSPTSPLEKYDSILEELKEQELKRQVKVMEAIREYVTVKTAPCLSKEGVATLLSNIEAMACNRPECYRPIRSDRDNPLRSPALRHLAWNVGERLRVPLAQRAAFIKQSFPHELENASEEYLRLNLRDQVPSQIPIDVPEKGDYRFHLETDNDES